jgi:formylglycine-generating enzyme required for sulfatase activity
MNLVLIPAGEFVMGSPDSDDEAVSDERPQHRVTITKNSYLGVYEVTQGQWEAVMGTKPWSGKGKHDKEGSDYPATFVSWKDAEAFCERLSEKEGRSYGLPTEAEWEYACRAETTTLYGFGDSADQLGEYAWFVENANASAHPVGTKKANAWGVNASHVSRTWT